MPSLPRLNVHSWDFGSLERIFRRTAVIHRARKAIQGDDCRPRWMSLLRFPWLFPIRNPSELRGLHRRSYFGTCGGGVNHFSSKCSGFLIRVSPSHPYNAGNATWGGGGGLRDAPEYKLICCIQDYHQRTERPFMGRSLVGATSKSHPASAIACHLGCEETQDRPLPLTVGRSSSKGFLSGLLTGLT